jgi:hypothetical protein
MKTLEDGTAPYEQHHVLDRLEARLLLKAAQPHYKYRRLLLLGLAGADPKEMWAVRPADVSHGHVLVQQKRLGSTKPAWRYVQTNVPRVLDVDLELAPEDLTAERLFPFYDGNVNVWLRKHSLRTLGREVTLFHLRRSLIAELLMDGVPQDEVARRAGIKSLTYLGKRYTLWM